MNLELTSQTEEIYNVLTDFHSTSHRRMKGHPVKF